MSPVTHLLMGWTVANISSQTDRKERIFITVAGIIPDIDGLVIIADLLTRNSDHPLEWWGKFHHVLAHNLGFGLLVFLVIFFLSNQRTACLAFLSFHIHLICDLLGSRGPEGYQWPIPYLLPFSNAWQLCWDGQWALNAWPNFLITGMVICVIFYLAWKRGVSPLEIVSEKADRVFTDTVRKRFGYPV
ncbi:metal-dependent hydrolase [Desulfonema magnum]|uniref:Hydrolase domain-containing protein n=1 Tax=Desulfonema magnum TaxID=45655 RepID=A0A975BPD7_9BACT|nr:metal-dependent hydrolase [Desulfonema magnum]QTA89236.1 Putative hydrolase domain-containing protein [Desulfonema magnum]